MGRPIVAALYIGGMIMDIKTYACTDCKEPTKTFAGFMDGHDENGSPAHGILYACSNKACSNFREFDKSSIIKSVQAANQAKGMDIKTLRDRIHATHNTMGSVAVLLDTTPSQVSRWLNEHEAMPEDVYGQLMHLLSKE